jgi:hypothetical protein
MASGNREDVKELETLTKVEDADGDDDNVDRRCGYGR